MISMTLNSYELSSLQLLFDEVLWLAEPCTDDMQPRSDSTSHSTWEMPDFLPNLPEAENISIEIYIHLCRTKISHHACLLAQLIVIQTQSWPAPTQLAGKEHYIK